MVGMWLGEISSCSCLTVLPGPAWVLLSKTNIPLFPPLYYCDKVYKVTISCLKVIFPARFGFELKLMEVQLRSTEGKLKVCLFC